jgi:small subunit ribosomal protein S8
MNVTDPIADMLTRIRNAHMVSKPSVQMPTSKVKLAIAQVLLAEGYLSEVSETQVSEHKKVLHIKLKYYRGKPVIERLERASRSGLRNYRGKDALPRVQNGMGAAIISTSKGMMTDAKAREMGLGGEVICVVA